MITQAQDARTHQDLSAIAQEPVTIEYTPSTLYALGSELACLRLFAKYQANGSSLNPKARCGFSKPRNSWFFSLER